MRGSRRAEGDGECLNHLIWEVKLRELIITHNYGNTGGQGANCDGGLKRFQFHEKSSKIRSTAR